MNYSEEEKEAIEQLRSWRDYIIKNKDKVNKANDIEFYLRTILNLIQKQEKIINDIKFIAYNNKPHITQEKIIEYFKKEVEKE